jgi:hypothetical protein
MKRPHDRNELLEEGRTDSNLVSKRGENEAGMAKVMYSLEPTVLSSLGRRKAFRDLK